MRDRLDVIYMNMKQRCLNPNNPAYRDYGERGITVCDEWKCSRLEFRRWALSNGYRDDLTIDRIDNNQGYQPSNCRWVTIKQNCNNRRSSHMVDAFGESHSLQEWSEILNISYNTLKKRYIDHRETGEYLLRPSRRKVV